MIDEDDLPSTHLDDDDYEAFLQRELTEDGRVKGDPPIGWIVLAVIVVLLLVLTLST